MTKTCLNCSRYTTCDHKKKSFTFVCDMHKRISQEDLFFTAKPSKSKKERERKIDEPVIITSDTSNTSDFNIEHVVATALSDSSSTPIDVKINDSHIPRARNFFEFATGEKFLNIKPYVEQMCIATRLFSEYCFHCTNTDWFYEDHKVDDSLRRFEKKVALLEYGKCPYCGTTKSKLFLEKKLRYYQEMAVSAGQRCVTGDTLIRTRTGTVAIRNLVQDFPYGFSDIAIEVFNGRDFELATRCYRAKPEVIYAVYTETGVIRGTADHPIWTDAWTLLKDVQVGMRVLRQTLNGVEYSEVVTKVELQEPEETFDFTLPVTHSFWSNGFLSHNSGKSALVAMMCAYITHKILKLQKPNEVYGLLHSNILQGTFVALTYQQAKDTLWDPYYNYVMHSPWFESYHAFLHEQSLKHGEELFKLNETSVVYRHRSLVVYPAGPDKRTLRGRTRCFACIPGNSLISTTRGLISMNQVQIGDRVNLGNKTAPITVHKHTGKKQLYKLVLSSGQELYASANHKIVVHENGAFIKRKLKDLSLNDKIAYTVGGKFPKELSLNYQGVLEHDLKDERSKLWATMYRLKTFDYSILLSESKTTRSRGSCTAEISKLVKRGFLAKFYRKGKMVEGMDRCYFTITNTFDLHKLIDTRNKGKFNRDNIVFPEKMTTDLAYILGYLVADGSNQNTEGKGIKFDCMDETRHEHYNECFERVFGISPKTYSYEYDGNLNCKGLVYRSTITYKKVIDFLRYCGIDDAYSAKKTIPWSILQAPRACIKAFLQAVFECDGGSHNGRVVYRSTSKRLLLQLQQILHMFELPSKLQVVKFNGKTKWKYGDKKIYERELYISGDDVYKFDSDIGFPLNTRDISSTHERDTDWKQRTVNRNWFTSTIERIVETDITVNVYDMTVDCDEHVYQANGVLVSNSIDEIGWFDSEADSKKIKMNANEIYVALERSLLTVRASANKLLKKGFNDIPTGYFLNISSPSSVRDKIMELVRKSENSNKIFGLIKPTWEMNPTVSYEDLEEEFRKDEVTAWRDYGARPPLSSNAFIQAVEIVERAITSKRNGAVIEYATKSYGEDSFRYGKIVNIKRVYQKSILALDAGLVNNSFACVSGYLDEDEQTFVVSTAIEVMPHPGSPVNFTLIYKNIISKIVEYQNVVFVVADRWNSAKFLSDLREDLGVATEQYSMKYRDFWLVRDFLFSNNILLPEPTASVKECITYDMDSYPLCYENKPIDHLVLQILTVRDTGNAITKGDGGLTDDLFRALALAVHRRQDEKAAELFAGDDEEEPESLPFFAVSKRIPQEASLSRRQIVGSTSGKAIATGKKLRR